ncbi:MAG: hypothetical protein K5739_06910 [Lachnospiraceae bacterium]|nr:hypothetical protein [Lachnospiraceae bacterium]
MQTKKAVLLKKPLFYATLEIVTISDFAQGSNEKKGREKEEKGSKNAGYQLLHGI